MNQKIKNLVRRLKKRVTKKTVKTSCCSNFESLFPFKTFRSGIQLPSSLAALVFKSHLHESLLVSGSEDFELQALSEIEDEWTLKEQLNKSDFFSYFDKYMNSQSDHTAIHSQMTFKWAKKKLAEFLGKEELFFESISRDFLSQLCKWFKTHKKFAAVTIKAQLSIYRAVVKYAQNELGLTGYSSKPLRCINDFIKDIEQRRTPIINAGTLLQLFLYEPDAKTDAFGWSEKMVIDFIKMARLCGHSTIGEVLELTKKQVGKTTLKMTGRNTKKNSKLVVTVYQTLELKRLIDQYRQKGNTTYVFPFLNLTATEKKQLGKKGTKDGLAYQQELFAIQRKKIQQILIHMNRHLRKIAATLNLSVKLNTQSLLLTLQHFDIQQRQNAIILGKRHEIEKEELAFGV